MKFFTSDLHFNHDREFIYKARGFNSVEEMNEAIVERWNAVVKPGDTVFVLGDLCLGGSSEEVLQKNKELIESLNGTIHIVIGNHDSKQRINMYKSCWNVLEVQPAKYQKVRGFNCYLTHYPCFTSSLEATDINKCTINLFGHTHQTTKFHNDIPFMYNIGCDAHNCTPVSEEEIVRDISDKIDECIKEL